MNVSKITRRNYSISGYPELILKLYHETDELGVAGIHDIQMMKAGSDGMLGGAIYFAETPEEARAKSEHKGIMLEVLVRVGWILVLTREANHSLSKEMIQSVGCDSVKSIGHLTGPEYVVYDPDQIIAAWAVQGIPEAPQIIFPGPEWDDRPSCLDDGICQHHNTQHFIKYKHFFPPVFPMKNLIPLQRPVCPTGSRCTNRTLDHFKMYSHPHTVLLPPIPRTPIQKPYRIIPKLIIDKYEKRHNDIYDDDTDDEYEGHVVDDKRPCPFGENCPHVDDVDHFFDYSHPPGVTLKLPCENGPDCKIMSEEHRREYSHKKKCGYGARCPYLDDIDHFFEFSHPHGTILKMPCEYGLRCTDTSEEHLREYSH